VSSVESAQQLIEIAIAGLRRRRFERAAERGSYAGLRRCNVHLDYAAVHRVPIRRRNSFMFQLHCLANDPNPAEVSTESGAKRE
jgi:hypothetical protein